MKVTARILLVLTAVALSYLLGRSSLADAQTTTPQRVVWEYKDAANLNIQNLNQLGADGWELVTMTTYGKDLYYILKRPK